MTSLIPSVTLVDGQPRVSSLDIAVKFGKRHYDVLRAIQRVMADLPSGFNERNFASVEYTDEKGEKRPAYSLTRDAFSLVAMGFTGKKALMWKVKYIEAFNAMEAELLKTRAAALEPAEERKRRLGRERLRRFRERERERKALPSLKKDKFEAYIEQVEAFRARTDAEIRRLLGEGLNLVDIYKFGPKGIRGFTVIIQNWLYTVAVSPSPLIAPWQDMDRAIEYSPLYLVREMEKI